ncbi:spatacsin [Aplysia californica]|uniref:Spatacsin n=1 Tax=Aplysia californica TaxID=6500 RepID=A0ABM0JTJ1_APLCA|nr:spatacsin [Aplysia californica]
MDSEQSYLTPLHYPNSEANPITWVKNSSLRDTIAARHDDGSFSVLKIKDTGHYSKFALDSQIKRLFWDNEDSSAQNQQLFAQDNKGDILLYTVDNEGVTLPVRVTASKIHSVVKNSSKDELELVGCDRGHAIFNLKSLSLVCVRMTQNAGIYLSCVLPLPDSTTGGVEGEATKSSCQVQPWIYQVLNGVMVVYDPDVNMMFMHLIATGHCICQYDVQPLGVDAEHLVGWRLSHDLSVLMIIHSDWSVTRVVISEFASALPTSVKLLDIKGQEQVFSLEYLNLTLSHYRDQLRKQQESLDHFSSSPMPKPKPPSSKKESVKKSKPRKKLLQEEEAFTKSLSAPQYQSSLTLGKENMEHWLITAAEASNYSLALALVEKQRDDDGKEETAICFANFSENTVNVHPLNDRTTVVLSSIPSCPHLLWSEKFLMLLSTNDILLKDDLISWVMFHLQLSDASSLSRSSQRSKAALILNALQSSLQRQQFDTVIFFFKSKQDLFSTAVQRQLGSMLVNQMYQLEDPLTLIMTSVTKSVSAQQSQMFAKRLLSLTLDFVYGLLDDATGLLRQMDSGSSEGNLSSIKDQIKESCKILLSQLPALRKCMNALKHEGKEIETFNFDDSTQTNVDMEQVIKDSKLSSLQFLLMTEDPERLEQYQQLGTELLDVVKTCLEQEDVAACQSVLNNLGCDVLSTLWSLTQFYASRSLQRFVVQQLSDAAALTQEQRQLVQDLEKFYTIYPLESFGECMKEKVHDVTSTWPDKDDPLKRVIYAKDVFLLNHCGDLSVSSGVKSAETSTDEMLYLSLPLTWLSQWSDETKKEVQIDAHFLTSSDAYAMLKSDPEATWKYLISHNLLPVIDELFQRESGPKAPWVLADPSKNLDLGWSHLRRVIILELLKLGQLSPDVAASQGTDINSLLPLVGGPLSKPHPLKYLGAASLRQFHTDFAASCVKNGLYLILWMYCTFHDIKPAELGISDSPSWFLLLQTFYSIPRHPTDKTAVLAASLMASAHLWGTPLSQVDVKMMLNKGQILAAVGTLSYMSEDDLKLDANVVERYLHKFPRLMAALLPDGQESLSKHRTTVYHLLMGCVPFNLRRLFGWNSTNPFAGEDSPKAMPHFSEVGLWSSHASYTKLSFPYYLKHGRPVYAFLSFLVEELDRKDAGLSQKRIQQTSGASLWIACQNFNTPSITSACVVFVELLGQDSLLVRSMIHTGRVLLSHRLRGLTGGAEARKEQHKTCVNDIVSELLACVKSHRRHGNKLIKSLELAIIEEIKQEGIGSCSFEASQKWNLVVSLCELLSVPLITCFLKTCAESDNWLMFVWFAQLHQYPTHQLQSLLHSFRSPHLRDHLHYVLNNADCKLFTASSLPSSVASSGQSATSSERKWNPSQRATLYSRIGVHSSKVESSSDEEPEKQTGLEVFSLSSRLKQAELYESDMPESSIPDDVFRMLFHSRSMPCQWKCLLSAAVSVRNPLLAELAVCCGCPAVPGLCGWLLASLSPEAKEEFLSSHGQLVSKWTLDHLESLIYTFLALQQEDVLTIAFAIMQPMSPVLPFLHFVAECVQRGKYASCKTYIDQFKEAMVACESQQGLEKQPSDVETIGDRAWFEKLVYQILVYELGNIASLYHARHLLEILDKQNMSLVFSFDVMDFTMLHKVVTILQSHLVVGVNLSVLLSSGKGSEEFKDQCNVAIDFLIGCSKCTEAQDLAQIIGMSWERIAICQLKEEKQKLVSCGLWMARYVRVNYWDKCQRLLSEAKCSPASCSSFFKDELRNTSVEHEKAIVCQHWHALLDGYSESEVVAERENVFRRIWRHRIAAMVSVTEVDSLDLIFDDVPLNTASKKDLKSELLRGLTVPHELSDSQEDLTTQELEVLDSLMGSHLDCGLIGECSQVAAVFGHYNQDLAIIQTCSALASRQIGLDGIEPAMRRLISKTAIGRIKRRSSSFSLSSSFSVSSGIDSLDDSGLQDSNEISSALEKLLSHCMKGSQVCLHIITCFKIAEILGVNYGDIVMAPEFESLQQLLRADHPNKFVLARDFLVTSGLSDDEVTGFLADAIVDMLKMFVRGHTDSDFDLDMGSSGVELMFNPADGMEVFAQFLKLCENTALLGDRILQSVASLAPDKNELSATDLTIQTELIVMSHECYTISSNMEGISHVLRAARVCCDCLAEAGEFTLMIRLLTGVGRYSEMLYVFHALQKHHQFELLLRKGMDREDKLKVAILDYLKRYQPDDNEAYTMVALKFSMFRDIANMLEACGHRSMKHLKEKSLDNSKECQDLLKKCLQYFQDAAESYVKDNSVRKAQRCIKLARLLSLQLQLLSSGLVVIYLSKDEVTNFINTHPRYIEAMVVSDAYERRADWAEAIYNNVIVTGDLRYLQEMKLHVLITPTIVEDVVKRYKQASVKPTGGLMSIRKLLANCKDAQMQYKLASELGLTDVVSTMLKGDTGSFLQDLTVV